MIRPLQASDEPTIKAHEHVDIGPSLLVARTRKGKLVVDGAKHGEVEFSIDGSAFKTFEGDVNLMQGGEVAVQALSTTEETVPSVSVKRSFAELPRHYSWDVFVSSEDTDGPARNLIDGDPSTYWHSQWQSNDPQPPHQAYIDFGKSLSLRGLKFTQRQGNHNGRVRDYRVEVSSDGQKWNEVAAGTLSNNEQPVEVRFAGMTAARFVRFIPESSFVGPWASMAEIEPIE